jgi:putative flippase GtrA
MMMTMWHTNNQQLALFCAIGTSIALIHWGTFCILITYHMRPLLANPLAYLLAFQCSYYCHRRWTFFSPTPQKVTQSFPRFALTSGSLFILNQSLLALLLHYSHLNAKVALCLALGCIAALSFLINKYWVFQ